MTTQLAFAFGVLSVIALIWMVVIVVGIVKVNKHNKEFKKVEEEFERIRRHQSEVDRNLNSEIRDLRNRFDQYTMDFRKELTAYTDSRVDKLHERISTALNKPQRLND